MPLESEINALIASTGKKTSTILQLLKETAMRIGEACRLKWIHIDLEHNTMTVNDLEKPGKPRMFKISNKLAAMLNALPRINNNLLRRTKARDASKTLIIRKRRTASKP
jgi:integrase